MKKCCKATSGHPFLNSSTAPEYMIVTTASIDANSQTMQKVETTNLKYGINSMDSFKMNNVMSTEFVFITYNSQALWIIELSELWVFYAEGELKVSYLRFLYCGRNGRNRLLDSL